MSEYVLLIVGATGQQGQAVIAALHNFPAKRSPVRILALTRSVSSPKSKALQEKYPEITLVEGNMKSPGPLFQTTQNISAIFLVTVPGHEEAQAIPLIDAATTPDSKVQHIVFSSVDRGGDQASWTNPTTVPHFASKHRIELYLCDACKRSGKQWTILRPTGFMDNYNPGFFGSMMASLWKAGLPPQRTMQLVSTHDIGVVAAKALLYPEQLANRAVGLAGDELTFGEACDVFKRVLGREMPQTWSFIAKGVIWWIEEARTSFEWFDRVGMQVDIQSLRHEAPEVQTFERWLRESSGWKDQIK
ncbi:hypothetical protein PV05_09517 [Exophiala xenobiotica]|uniref:NmrA-like domain-containing protein n=1 Tax=Exophiala xenobiotica TaxID=348802 RepID=A0A0D2ESD7_9EURO|nr:uncharacterized protein PV05_09517 [Exophiala xenobiotica]KIW50729.1 hypothetical protein PV05_09517 [Exophiala xenobiotica]